MYKYSQSLIDFLTIFPFPLEQNRNSITTKEAETLIDIWNGNRDEYGNILIPDSADTLQVASLTTKGFIKTKSTGRIATYAEARQIEITDKGKEVIKKFILQNEKSAFEEKTNLKGLFSNPIRHAGIKTASSNWLKNASK